MNTKITMNGRELSNLTELRENFDIEAAIELQKNGQLSKWLEEIYYEAEAEKVRPYRFNNWSNSERKRFCSILGVDYAKCLTGDARTIFDSNRLKLSEITNDIAILNNADAVAADQSQLAELINNGEKTIVLYKGEFSIPMSKSGITYYCVGSPKISGLCTAEQYKKLGIIVNGIDLPKEEDKANEGRFREAALSNGYDFFYEEHSALANYFHKELQAIDVPFYCNIGTIDSLPTFKTRSECEKAKNAEIKRFYNKAASYLSPSAEHGLVRESENYYSQLITDVFNDIKDGLRVYCEHSGKTNLFEKLKDLCNNASANLRKLFTEEITNGDYYKMYDINYFLNRVDIIKDDYSEGWDPASRLLMRFTEGCVEYRYESPIDVIMELQDDINNLSASFGKTAHSIYNDYVKQIEGLAEKLGNELFLHDGTNIKEYFRKLSEYDSHADTKENQNLPKSTAKIIQI